jgi:hypothetical protein
VDIGGFGFLHAEGAFLGRGILRGSLDVKESTAFGKQRSELAALDATDFDVIGSNNEKPDWLKACGARARSWLREQRTAQPIPAETEAAT